MSDTPIRKRRRVLTAPVVTAPLIQVLAEHRARIDPSAVPDLVCFLFAVRDEYDRAARMTWSGLKGVERERRKGQVAWAKDMRAACDALMTRLMQTVDLRLIDRARREWTSIVAPSTPEG